VLFLVLVVGTALAQLPRGPERGLPDPIPPPLPQQKPKDEDKVGNYRPLLADSEAPWGLPAELLESLHVQADRYQAYTRRFSCTETARLADYDSSGSVAGETERVYGYLLTQPDAGQAPREYRQRLNREGKPKQGEVKDEEPFPPAYAWVLLFSRFNEPYFSYRSRGDRFEGFDWVYELHFRGSMPFTDGKDIRQWEGIALVDAATFTPLEIQAEPQGQHARIDALYRRWAKSFNFMGLRAAPKPLAYRALVEFRLRREGLSFPTRLRYDTLRAVSPKQVFNAKASTRVYRDYRIFRVRDEQSVGGSVDP
jgi:hypothetical protein